MSAVAGLVHLDGGRPAASELNSLVAALAQWGHGSTTVHSDNAVLVATGFGRVGSLPASQGNPVFTSSARLDNRDELSDALGASNSDVAGDSDAGLVGRAFERWGSACATRLNGDWSLAVWLPAERRLFLARDHFGNTGLYYSQCGARVAFASDFRALQTLGWIPKRLDDARIASLLVGGGVDDAHNTVYRDIARLPPAHSMTIDPGTQRLDRYWRVEDTPDSGPMTPGERAEQLRTAVRAAVGSRLRDARHAGAMLSGGIDSGAVTAFAAQHVSRLNQRLTAFTAVPAFETAPPARGSGRVNEGPAAAEIVRAFESIDHVLVTARAVSPLAGIRRGLMIHGEPLVAAANYGWLTELLAEAAARGVTHLLTGSVGDFVMAGRPAEPDWRRDWSAGAYRQVLKQLTPNWVLRLRRANWSPSRLAEAPWRPFSVVNGDFAAEVRLLDRMRDSGRDPRDLKRRAGRSGVVRQATSYIGAIWAPLSAVYGVTVLDPLEDKRVMDVMFAAPRPDEGRAGDRWLFRRSLVGLLPNAVVQSRTKGMQSSDIVEQLRASWAEVEDALAAIAASPLARRCIDVPYCRQLARRVRESAVAAPARREAFLLVHGLSAALFLAEHWENAA